MKKNKKKRDDDDGGGRSEENGKKKSRWDSDEEERDVGTRGQTSEASLMLPSRSAVPSPQNPRPRSGLGHVNQLTHSSSLFRSGIR